MILDVVLIGIVALVTWCVASEGAWGAGFTLFSVVLSGLLAMNFYEVTAEFLQQNLASSLEWQHRWDVIALVGLFAGFVLALRTATDRIMPVDIEVQMLVFDVTRWGCAALAGYTTMAFLLTALHTAPVPREFLGFAPEPQRRGGPVGQLAPDLQWLGFTQYVSEHILRRGRSGPIFDGPTFEVYAGAGAKVWPSFPLRYATRRERYYFSSSSAPSGPAVGPPRGAAPPPPGPPRGGGGTTQF
jgi:hypothetical protein